MTLGFIVLSPWCVGQGGDPPAFYGAQLRVRDLDVERQARDPHVHLQLSRGEAVGEVH